MEVHIEHIVKVVEVHILDEDRLVVLHIIVDIVEMTNKDIVVNVDIEDIVDVTVEFMVEMIQFRVKKHMIKDLVVIKS